MTVRPVPLAAPPEANARPADPARPSSSPTDVSDAERQALDRAFPASPTLTLRLYGRAPSAAPPAPVGTHLDLRG